MTAGVRGKTPVVIYKPLPCRAEGYTRPCWGKAGEWDNAMDLHHASCPTG